MGKSLGNQHGVAIVRRQPFGMPVQKSYRPATQVDSNIPYFAMDTIHQFHFGMWRPLKMHATYGATFGCECVINLSDWFMPAGKGNLFGAKQTRKKTPAVSQSTTLDTLKTE
ncbi:MAG: hypothetical protein PHH11_13070 [Methylomonas sp.]|nr:hypothetical protein [Methylomonas sp.]